MGGYRTAFDPRPSLHNLELNVRVEEAWHELWQELHHQGDVGEASYAALPHLVRIHGERKEDDWNTYALVAVIELARGKGKNPDVPEWLKKEYFSAIQDMAKLGLTEILRAKDPEHVRVILSVIALAKDARTHARFLLDYSEEEMIAFERQAQEGRPVLKVAVMSDGRITIDGSPATIDSVREALKRLAEQKGVVWYYREAPEATGPPESRAIIQAVIENRLSIRLSSRPDYSDAIGAVL